MQQWLSTSNVTGKTTIKSWLQALGLYKPIEVFFGIQTHHIVVCTFNVLLPTYGSMTGWAFKWTWAYNQHFTVCLVDMVSELPNMTLDHFQIHK